ncbi:MAG TPA: histidine phosphatase family protein [Rhizomicrobium sp.]|nr:histidine phosphatase family protein [Rhizomicrobium sp.]
MGLRRLTLICHAATASQREGRFPLPDESIMTGTTLHGPCNKVPGPLACAPEKRALETALLLAPHASTMQALRDCDFGAWMGKSVQEIQLDDPAGTAAWLCDPGSRPHGGESLAELCERVGRWLDGIRENGHTFAVTHASVMRAAALHVLGAPFAAFWRLDIQPLSAMDMRFDGQFWTIRSLNDHWAD